MGIFSKRINKAGAISGMLTGLLFTFAYIIVYKGVFFEPLRENIPANWLFGISPEGIGVVGMLLNFSVAIVVSKLGDEPPESVQQLVEEIRIPGVLRVDS
jgi:cation/acetate symporter